MLELYFAIVVSFGRCGGEVILGWEDAHKVFDECFKRNWWL